MPARSGTLRRDSPAASSDVEAKGHYPIGAVGLGGRSRGGAQCRPSDAKEEQEPPSIAIKSCY